VVLALGATLNMWTTRHGRLLGPAATVIQCDIEADAIGSQRPVALGILGDARETALALDLELERRGQRGVGWRTRELGESLKAGRWRLQPYEDRSGNGHIDPRTLTIRLDELLPYERLITVDSGHFMGWPSMYMRVPDDRGFVFTQAFQAVGLGLASAIGAAFASPERLVVATLGDGGALMGLSELETLVRLRLPILVVVYNDAAFGAEVHHFAPHGAPLDLVRFPDVDLASLARGAGAQAATVRAPEDLEVVPAWLASGDRGPLLLDAKVVPDVVGEWLQEAFGH
jgi:thiamine pyrophosphate-dependent acetolactate synthase large subunit-like protein